MNRSGRNCIVIGIGNPDRGDDAAGIAVARRLCRTLACDIDIVEESGEATALMMRLEGTSEAYLVDACSSEAVAGTIRRFDVARAPLTHIAFGASTHGFGVAEAIELARTLGQLPPLCIVYAIEGASFESGAPLSPPVAEAVTRVVERLSREIAGGLVAEDQGNA